MSATALANPTDTKQGFDPQKFDTRPLFSPVQVTLSSSEELPAHLPVSFVLAPEVERGNIKVTVRDVEFNSLPPNPTWKFREGTVNREHGVSIVMEDNLGDLLVLTGDREGDVSARNNWNSKVLGNVANGKWSSQQGVEIGSFSSHFSWTFLLDPGEGANDDRETIILEFDILVSGTRGILQQVSSFPSGWKAFDFQADNDGISLKLTRSGSPEQYDLEGGFFIGGLSKLVCQGGFSLKKDGPAPGDGGTWTGTSGGPPSPGM